MKWINFIHFYQPANIEREKLFEASEKSYAYLFSTLEKNPDAKFTANISGCLIERWSEDPALKPFIERAKKLAQKGQLEITGTAAYHPILPLVMAEEAEHQIKEHEAIIRKFFGPGIRLKGFFMPELAYGSSIAKLVKKLGYEWIIVDEISCDLRKENIPLTALETDSIDNLNFIDKNSGLRVILRNRQFSKEYVPTALLKALNPKNTDVQDPIITATDAELYGLRHIDRKKELATVISVRGVKTETVSQYLDKNKRKNPVTISLKDCSWESSPEELMAGNPYSLWNSPKNQIQSKLWQFADLAQSIFYRYKDNKNAHWARWHLVRGLASCTFWWASSRDLSDVFGPVAWSPAEVDKGLNELLSSIRSLESSTDLKLKLQAEKQALEIKKILWESHWKRLAGTK